jgi:hypothetical protein
MADEQRGPGQLLEGGSEHRAEVGRHRVRRNILSGRARLVALVACLGVMLTGVSVAIFSSAGSHENSLGLRTTASNSQASTVQPSAQTQSSSVTAVPAGTASGVSSSARPNSRQQREVARWSKGPGGKALAAVEKHLGTAMQTAGIKLYTVMRLACVSLAPDVATAKAAPPLPNAARERLYINALTELSGAAANCRAAISLQPGDEVTDVHLNRALLQRSRVQFAAVARKLYRATGGA